MRTASLWGFLLKGPLKFLSLFADASESIAALGDQDVCLTRRMAKVAADGFGALSSLGFAAMYLCGLGWLLAPVRLIDTASDAVECQINASNFNEMTQLERKVSGDGAEPVAHSKKYYMLKTIVKATACDRTIVV